MVAHDLLEATLLSSQLGHLLLHSKSLRILLLLLKVLQSSGLLLVALTCHVLAPLLSILTTVVLLAALLVLVSLGSLVLLTVKELIADAEVLLHGVNEVAEAIVVAIYFHAARNERVNPIVVTDNLDIANDAEAGSLNVGGCFREDLVVVARDVQVGDGIARAYLYFAVVASQVYAVTWFGERHAHAVVCNVD